MLKEVCSPVNNLNLQHGHQHKKEQETAQKARAWHTGSTEPESSSLLCCRLASCSPRLSTGFNYSRFASTNNQVLKTQFSILQSALPEKVACQGNKEHLIIRILPLLWWNHTAWPPSRLELMNEQDSQGKPLTTACLAHRACLFTALGMSASVSNGSPSPGNMHRGKVQPYESMFSFLFLPFRNSLKGNLIMPKQKSLKS